MADTATHWSDSLRRLGACSDAIKFARGHDSLAAAWAACEDPRWLLWYAGRVSGGSGSDARRRLVLCACECARLVLHLVPAGEDRPRVAIETAEAWARGGDGAPSIEYVRAAAYAAYAAACAADDAADDAAAYAAYAYAAYAAAAAAADAADATSAAYAAAADATSAAADDAVRKKTLTDCLAIVRRHYPEPPQGEEQGT